MFGLPSTISIVLEAKGIPAGASAKLAFTKNFLAELPLQLLAPYDMHGCTMQQ